MTYRWPGYYESSPPTRTYALDYAGRLILETGEWIEYESWPELKHLMFEHDLIVITDDLYKYLQLGAVSDKRSRVLASANGGVRSIAVSGELGSRYARRRRIIASCDGWDDFTIGMLKRIRDTMTHCGVGDRATPSSLGIAIMRSIWQEYDLPWHKAAPLWVQERLSISSPSPRTETPGEGYYGDEAWEYDMNSAFAHHFREHPTGRVVTIGWDDNEWYEECPTWFRRCYVKHPPKCRFTCIPRRVEGQWRYEPAYGHPDRLRDEHMAKELYTLSGGVIELETAGPSPSFVTWLWREQAECAREYGCLVMPSDGFGWLSMTEDNKYCSDRLLELKDAAPTQGVKDFVKAAIVAGIGRHAMRGDEWQVIDHFEAEVPEGECVPLALFTRPADSSPFTDYYLLLRNKHKGGMIHWQRYTVMRTNQTLFTLAKKYHKNLLMTNFDSITLRKRIRTPRGWKELPLTEVEIPYSRAIISREKRRTPGRVIPISLG